MNQQKPSYFRLDNGRLFAIAVFLAAASLWITPYLPMVDLPQHTAQVVSLQELWAGTPMFRDTFTLQWFQPYTLTYLMLYTLALVMPVTLASKVFVTVMIVAIPLLTGRLLKELGAHVGLRWLAIPCGFGVAFHWGFLPFMGAVPMGLLLILLTIRFGREPTPARGIGIAAATFLLFFFHVIALGAVALLCLAYLAFLNKNYRNLPQLARLWLPYTAGLPPMAYWFITTLNRESYVQGADINFGLWWERPLALLSLPMGFGFTEILPAAALGLVVFLYPLISGARFTQQPERRALLGTLVLLLLIMPTSAFGAIFLYPRLSVFLLPVFLLAWDYPKDQQPRFAGLVIAIIFAISATNVYRFSVYGQNMTDLHRTINVMEPQKYVRYVGATQNTPAFAEPMHLHTGVWYQAEKRGIVDFNFAFFYPSMVRFQEGRHFWVTDTAVWRAEKFDWEKDQGAFYDYFLVHSAVDVTAGLFRGHEDDVELLTRNGWWWLYRVVPADRASQAAQ